MQLWLAIAALVSAAAAVAGVAVDCYKARNERRGPRRDRARLLGRSNR